MNLAQEYMYNKIVEDWENFPYKLDYIIHLLCSNNSNYLATNIQFQLIDDAYVAAFVGDKYKSYYRINHYCEINGIQYDKLTIKKVELLDYFNINEPEFPMLLTYGTEIFTNPISIQMQRINDINSNRKFFALELLYDEKFNANELNNKLDNYTFFYHLNEIVPNKNKNIKNKIKL
jgi:hypothetical protein